jgi:hypothetical protein
MPPLQVELWAGNDPGHLRLIKKINPEQPVKNEPRYMKGYDLSFKNDPGKIFETGGCSGRETACLAWEGQGDKGWAFVDEIFLN